MLRKASAVLDDLDTYSEFNVGRNPGLITADRLALVERLRKMIDGEPVRVIYDAASKGMFHGLLDRLETEIRAAAEGGQ